MNLTAFNSSVKNKDNVLNDNLLLINIEIISYILVLMVILKAKSKYFTKPALLPPCGYAITRLGHDIISLARLIWHLCRLY